MPRKRMIDPDFWTDEEIGKWPAYAKLLYIGLWSLADDEGRFRAESRYITSTLFPYKAPKRPNVDALLGIIGSKLVLYEVNGQKYGFIKNFAKYQSISHPTPSKLPAPDFQKSSEEDRKNSPQCSLMQFNLKEVKGIPENQPPRPPMLGGSSHSELKPKNNDTEASKIRHVVKHVKFALNLEDVDDETWMAENFSKYENEAKRLLEINEWNTTKAGIVMMDIIKKATNAAV